MPTETKKRIRQAILPGMAVILLTAALTVLVCRVTTPAPAARPQTAEATEPAQTAWTLPASTCTTADFCYDGAYLVSTGGRSMVGIDVSHHQGQIDWEQVRAAGIDFVMVRLGYRGTSEGNLYTDDYALENLAGARQAGLLVGAYFFSQAVDVAEALEEANYALDILGTFSLDLPLAYDWEPENRTAQVDGQTVTDCAALFCYVVESAGYDAMVYFNSYQALEQLSLERLTGYAWWLAMYTTEGTFPCRFDMWQYSCTGSVPGISGDVDVNVLALDP